MTLPFGTQLKLGRERLRFGFLNEFHQHDRPFIDNPNVLVLFLGDEGLVENGAELSWVAPLPVYLQAILGVFDGDNTDAFGRGSLRDPLTVGGEVFLAHRRSPVPGDTSGEPGEAQTALRRTAAQEPDDGEPAPGPGFERRNPYGYYVWTDVQPWKRWVFGVRYDWTEFPDGPGHEWAIGPYVGFMPSEFPCAAPRWPGWRCSIPLYA
jgi:hypothetical protein